MKTIINLNEKKVKLEWIEFLRGFSILTIVFAHLIQGYIGKVPGIIMKASTFGGKGVHDFFFCSGIGLYLSHLRHPLSGIEFLKRKVWRIYIPYILVVIVSTTVPSLYQYDDKGIALLSHIFLFKMFVPKYECSFGGQFWYISTLFQFYLLFNLIVKFKERVKKKFFWYVLFCSIFWWVLMVFTNLGEERVWGSFFLQYIWEFAAGMCIAEKIHNGEDICVDVRILVPTAVLGVILAAWASQINVFFRVANDIVAFAGYISVALLLYSVGWSVVNRSIIFISRYSYEWYLTHILVFHIVVQLWKPVGSPSPVSGIVAVVVSFIVAIMYNILWKKVHMYRGI